MMSDNSWLDFSRSVLRTTLVVGYGQVVLGVVSFTLILLRAERAWNAPFLRTLIAVISAPLLPGLYLVAALQGKPTPGPGTPLPLVLGLALNCVIYSALWLVGAALLRFRRRVDPPVA